MMAVLKNTLYEKIIAFIFQQPMQCLQNIEDTFSRNDRLGILDFHVHRLSFPLPPLIRCHFDQGPDDHTGNNHPNHANQLILLIILNTSQQIMVRNQIIIQISTSMHLILILILTPLK